MSQPDEPQELSTPPGGEAGAVVDDQEGGGELSPFGRPGPAPVRRLDDAFGFVLLAIIVTLFMMGLFNDSRLAGLVDTILFLGIFFLALLTSGVSKRRVLLCLVVVPPSLVAASLGAAQGDIRFAAAPLLISAALLVAGAIVIARRVWRHVYITLRMVMGTLAIYLLVPMLFAIVYRVMAVVTGQPFFVQTSDPTGLDYLYFSIISIATVGFGDFTPATSLGKMTVAIEAISGQLYLVTVVAVFVANLGRKRGERRR
jgi:hypothetical protein